MIVKGVIMVKPLLSMIIVIIYYYYQMINDG
jgi:hypothetical protein